MSLETIRTFHKMSPGVFKYIQNNVEIPVVSSGNKALRKIRPTEYKAYLKVKCTENPQCVSVLLVIEAQFVELINQFCVRFTVTGIASQQGGTLCRGMDTKCTPEERIWRNAGQIAIRSHEKQSNLKVDALHHIQRFDLNRKQRESTDICIYTFALC